MSTDDTELLATSIVTILTFYNIPYKQLFSYYRWIVTLWYWYSFTIPITWNKWFYLFKAFTKETKAPFAHRGGIHNSRRSWDHECPSWTSRLLPQSKVRCLENHVPSSRSFEVLFKLVALSCSHTSIYRHKVCKVRWRIASLKWWWSNRVWKQLIPKCSQLSSRRWLKQQWWWKHLLRRTIFRRHLKHKTRGRFNNLT